MALYVQPEIDRRDALGLLPGNFSLTAAQVIFPPASSPYVRLNDEVVAVLRTPRAQAVTVGDHVDLADIDVTSIGLTSIDDDNGHFTLFNRGGDNWAIGFDSRRNASKARLQADAAHEFIETAVEALAADRGRVTVDLLFSGVELLAGAELLVLPIERHPRGRIPHAFIHTTYNRRRKSGNALPEFVDLLNRLADLRAKARYRLEPVDTISLEALTQTAKRMEEHVRAQIPTRTTIDPALIAHKPKPPLNTT